MTVVQLSEDNFLIVTGGDDNALAFTRVDFGGALPFGGLVSSTLLIPKAHASAITANTFVGMATSEQQDPPFLRFATSSNDQRLKLWSACIDLNKQGVDGLKIRRDANVYTSVADVSSMGVLPYESRPKILVCGVGMDMWTINQ